MGSQDFPRRLLPRAALRIQSDSPTGTPETQVTREEKQRKNMPA
jgi:hypothetical protein